MYRNKVLHINEMVIQTKWKHFNGGELYFILYRYEQVELNLVLMWLDFKKKRKTKQAERKCNLCEAHYLQVSFLIKCAQ